MLKWLIRWASHQCADPERLADRALRELRVKLYRAEQLILDARMEADYYCTRIVFCEAVVRKGIEQVSDVRRACQEMSPRLWPELELSGARAAVSSEPVATTLDATVSRPVLAAKGG
ncbi:hypothetical protein [Paraburkholderia franconis]|uniref:hypothetical protein n=1 Tax=Paraburkholderia franconis TaxID=2654983 RepID=UPI00187B4577|nr:hypothetical protein [Paraburkholderia franconis]